MGGCVLALYLVLWLAMCLFESGLFEGDASGCEAYLSPAPALQNKETNRQKHQLQELALQFVFFDLYMYIYMNSYFSFISISVSWCIFSFLPILKYLF